MTIAAATGPGRSRLAELGLPARSREIVSDCLAVIDNLTPLIDQLDGELHQHAKADARVRMLMSLPEVGEFTALLTLAEVGDVTRFRSARELASWPELIPTVCGSDLPIGRGHIAGQGSASLRRVYCQAAQIAIRSRPFASHAATAERRGAKAATVAIARQLLAHAWYLLVSTQVIDTSTPIASTAPPPRQP